MPYLEDLITRSMQDATQQLYAVDNWMGKPDGMAYASFYPEWEVTTPQYPTPNPYSLAQLGYRTNELVFTCINVRADSIAEAPLWVFDDTAEKCDTCLALNGIVAYAWEWETAGFRPQSPPNALLTCGGWHCECELRHTEKRRSPSPHVPRHG